MAKSLSLDLRQRVIAAIDGGLSCRAAAERFGVSAASAIRWRDRQKKAGDFTPQKQGGDRRSRRIEEHSQWHCHGVCGLRSPRQAGSQVNDENQLQWLPVSA
jgi:transposase